ncbi:MAG: metallophosphoesterase [Ruminiclostridium sp.]|nr:metallophosphoesterase [Ruminiclostridium sp.]
MTRRKLIILSAIITAVAVATTYAFNTELECISYTVQTDKVFKPVKLAFLSDVHSSYYGYDMGELVNAVKRFDPDAVIFGGDLFNKHRGEGYSMTLVKRLTALYPCIYSIGNHETYGEPGEERLIKQDMRDLGVTVLDGGYVDIGNIRISGIDGAAYTNQVEACEKELSPDMFNVLINHYPEEFPVLSGRGFDLILSGHAHGGQWRFPPLLNGVYASGQGIFPKYTAGEYYMNGTEMIVSKGLERRLRELFAPRIFNRPELTLITVGQ